MSRSEILVIGSVVMGRGIKTGKDARELTAAASRKLAGLPAHLKRHA